jgi:hypothetical protein
MESWWLISAKEADFSLQEQNQRVPVSLIGSIVPVGPF